VSLYFLDSSALVKRYVTETGSAWIKALVTRHPLRAYDAVQLASALRVQSELVRTRAPALTFLSADDRLVAIAQAEGLLTDNPNRHL
jgi:predicted nucleic acid-binding protein